MTAMLDQFGVAALIASSFALMLAVVATEMTVPLATAVARAARAMDYGGGRRSHEGAVPRLGGVAIAAGIVFGAGSVALLRWEQWGSRLHTPELVALVLASGMVFLVGTLEDLVRVPAWRRFVVELAAAGLLVAAGWRFDVLGVPGVGEVTLGWLAPVVTVVWLVGVTNAVNLLDGLDGLAGGVVGIIAVSYLVLCFIKGDLFSTVLMAAIAGACLGFLRHNRPPARIFMGDAGSLTLGFLLAAIAVHSSLKASAAVAILVPVLALGVPVIDTLLVMLGRFVRRPGGSAKERIKDMFRADESHLHHVLQELRMRRTKVVRTIYVLVLLSCAAAAYVSVTKRGGIGWLLLGGEIGVIAFVRQMRWTSVLAQRVAQRREEAEAPEEEERALRPAVGNGRTPTDERTHGVMVEMGARRSRQRR